MTFPAPLPDGSGFREPWEAQAFAMVHELHAAGHFGWREWTRALGEALANSPPDTPYYLCWLSALERLAAEKGLADQSARKARQQAWREAYESTPHGEPVELR